MNDTSSLKNLHSAHYKFNILFFTSELFKKAGILKKSYFCII